ncbi:hypothetical protein PAXRUDRAFT_30521 [Paxillus rubicundulus Ve08.2h10]|uniref:Uncharacterized protein n=1 Tax=Paxillus rubicundulus Ve08.2h10 TaxID=930991 RepID=A0A0D0E4S1_9AGAM|nr:hypothetical protein PAXRUDRAFT_30521 [Paxillus rubicundulus Ve08.2h10]
MVITEVINGTELAGNLRPCQFKVAGGVLSGVVTAYQTFWDPSNPCIVCPTCHGAKLSLGGSQVLDPRKHYVLTFALSCNPPPYNSPYFPEISYEDDIWVQHAVLTKVLGVKKKLFILGGPKVALSASKDLEDGHYSSPPQHGIRAFGRVILGWVYGQAWFKEEKYPDLNAFVRERWEGGFLQYWDANDMTTLLTTWQKGDISLPEDSKIEVSHLRDAALHPTPTVLGHVAGGGASPVDVEFISEKIYAFLNSLWRVIRRSQNCTFKF